MKAIPLLMTGLTLCLSLNGWANAENDFTQAAKANAEARTERQIDTLIAKEGCSTKLAKPIVNDGYNIYYVTTTNCTCAVQLGSIFPGETDDSDIGATCYQR